jgi:hypothetical protein
MNLQSNLTAKIENQQALIENPFVQLVIGWENGLRLQHLIYKPAATDWIPQPPDYPWGSEKFHAALLTKNPADLWPDLAPPSDEFLIRFTPQTIADTIDSVTANQAPSCVIEHTGRDAATFLPDKSQTWVRDGVARLDLAFACPGDHLTVTIHTELYSDLPIARRWATICNIGLQPVLLHRALSLLLSVRPSYADLDLYWIEAFVHPSITWSPSHWRQGAIHQQRLGPNVLTKLRYGVYPRPHDGFIGCMGWAALRDPTLDQGIFLGWEWSGMFDATIGDFQNGAGAFGVHAGFSDEGNYARTLRPGDEFTTSKAFFGFFTGDEEQAGQATRNVAEKLFGLPWPEKKPPAFIGHCTWNNWQDFKGSRQHLRPERLDREIERCDEIGVELFIFDYDWFPYLGDYIADPARFPDGIEPWARKIKSRGMKFGLWTGFGQAHPDSQVAREHPDWIVTRQGRPVIGGWGMYCLCLGYTPCRDWVLEQLTRVIESFGVDWLKHDFDLIAVSDAHHHAPNATDTRIESVLGYYHILEQLHQRFPSLYLDNWTPPLGGADFGAFQRHHSTMIIDWYMPVAIRSSLHGLTHLFPHNRLHSYLRPFSEQDEQSSYSYRSAAFGNGLVLMTDILQWSQRTVDVAQCEIERIKQDRGLFLDGRVYNLIPRQPDHYGWEARFVYSPSQAAGMAQVFRNHHPRSEMPIHFQGLDANTTYDVTFVDAGKTSRLTGWDLETSGLTVTLPTPFTCEILRLNSAK